MDNIKKVKGFIQIGLIIMIVILSGCTTRVEDREIQLSPKTSAFKDDFTREFMVSTEEVQEGYYEFKSKTEGYTMLFPVNAKVGTLGFGLNQDVFETYSFGEQVKEKNLAYYYRITYQNSLIAKDIEFNLESLSEYAGYVGDYNTFEHEDKTYYYATDVYKIAEGTSYNYFAYIKSNKSDKALEYFASSTCLSESQKCNAGSKEIEERFLMLMKSVDF